ncbi:MAG: trypsin-like peptidase domain-containing protein [Clostridia bacterium]|nr:trypsin-like peptidase domain-containing protein [Clostridia bacterium]
MEEFNTTNNTQEQGEYCESSKAAEDTAREQREYYAPGAEKPRREKSKGNGAGGYVLTGVLCLLLGIAIGSGITALALSGIKQAVGSIEEKAPSIGQDIEDALEDFFGDGFDFEWRHGNQKPAQQEQSDEYQEQEAREYITRELPEFDGVQPVITDTANPAPDIVEQVFDGVVGINTYSEYQGEFVQDGYGSGFVVASEGYIVTNAHVIRGGDKITVTFSDQEEVDAEVVGSDSTLDVAVLKVEKSGLTPLALGDSDPVRVGEFTIAIGNPSGTELAGTTTFGIISATARSIHLDGRVNNFIQTDAAINPGNSGGPLLNMRGEVIGITTAKNIYAGYDEYGNSISAEGLGFAIPINEAMNVVCQLIENGRMIRPGMGIQVIGVDAESAEYYGIPEGILIYSVTRNGSAHKAGLKVDDIIVEYDGIAATTQDAFVEYVQTLSVGDVLHLTVNRSGESVKVDVTMADMNEMGDELVGGTSKILE